MDRIVLLAVVALGLGACGGDSTRIPRDDVSSGPVTGVIVDVEQTSPVEVQSFVVKDGDDRYDFVIDPDHNYGFPLAHLREHLVSADPVKVRFEERDGDLVALEIEDV